MYRSGLRRNKACTQHEQQADKPGRVPLELPDQSNIHVLLPSNLVASPVTRSNVHLPKNAFRLQPAPVSKDRLALILVLPTNAKTACRKRY